jgi:flagellar biosynthetic protein FlhB
MPGERTEQATPKRRQEARERGQVLKSVEVNTAALLLAAAAGLQWLVPGMAGSVLELTRATLAGAATGELTASALAARAPSLSWFFFQLVGPLLLGLAAVGVASNVLQFGFLFSGQAIRPQFSRINPVDGARRLYSSRSLVELAKTLLKVAVVGGVAWQAVRGQESTLALLSEAEPGRAAGALSGAIAAVLWKVAGALAVLAGADFLYQRWWFERSLRMSREEIKEELKQQEGDPHIRARLRQRARALTRQRMMQQVPKADVVITNPTHYAVAIQYEAGMEAPVVLAKGERLIAQQIKKVAREHGVPTVENRPLAQALYKACQVGQAVPAELYRAVAEVLAFVYRLHPHRAPAGFGRAA